MSIYIIQKPFHSKLFTKFCESSCRIGQSLVVHVEMAWSTAGQYIMVGTWVPTGLSGTVLLLEFVANRLGNEGCGGTTQYLQLPGYVEKPRSGHGLTPSILTNVAQILLLVSNIIQTIEIPLGFRRHLVDVPVENKPLLGLLDKATATQTILAATWGKTAFTITLLRITTGWAKTSVWLVIVTMNIYMLLLVVLGWAQCSPPAKLWELELPGTCLPPEVRPDYNIFSGGEQQSEEYLLDATQPDVVDCQREVSDRSPKSVRGRHGPLPGSVAVNDPPKASDEDQREDWRRDCDEHGGFVCQN